MPEVILTVFGSVTLTRTGYLRIKSGPHRDKFLHQAVFEEVAGRPPRPGFDIHHQDFNKHHNCPHNLVEIQRELHPPQTLQCPYTGRLLSRTEYARRFGLALEPTTSHAAVCDDEVPF